MDNLGAVSSKPPKSGTIPRWMGLALIAVGFWLLHIVVPWHLSLLNHRHGWAQGRPGKWNLLGLIGVVAGIACVIWAMFAHFVQSPEGWTWERTPKYLLRRAPYTFTRNPMYLAELVLWLGWAMFYGSLAVFLGFLVGGLAFHFFVVPWEERTLAARFGEAYAQYRSTVPRWLGPRRSERAIGAKPTGCADGGSRG